MRNGSNRPAKPDRLAILDEKERPGSDAGPFALSTVDDCFQTMPWATMASATLMKPAMLAPST